MSDCIGRDALLKDIEENVVFSVQTPNAEVVGANKVIRRIKAAPVADTMPKWTKVEDGLPENGVDVLCWYEYFRYGSYNQMFRTYGIGYQYNGNWAGNAASGHKARVLAWMPLPNPPKGQKVGCSK